MQLDFDSTLHTPSKKKKRNKIQIWDETFKPKPREELKDFYNVVR